MPTTDAALLDLLARPGLSTKADGHHHQRPRRGHGRRQAASPSTSCAASCPCARPPGQGTTFTLRIPLSITIVDAFSFLCGGETFVVPVAMIEEMQELDRRRTVRGPDRRRTPRGDADRRRVPRATEMIERRGEAVPVLRLDELLGLERDAPDGSEQANERSARHRG